MTDPHPLHDYLSEKLAEHLQRRRVVVWYDPRREFEPFVGELCEGGPPAACRLQCVRVAGIEAQLAVFRGSFLEVRAIVEPVVSGDSPAPLVVYAPGAGRDAHGSLLMELETAGHRHEPQLKRQARNVFLRQGVSDGVIDGMLATENLSYADAVGLLEGGRGTNGSSLLKLVFPSVGGNESLVAAWLADPSKDAAIDAKGARDELFALLSSRLGLELKPEPSLSDARTRVLRYALVGEFRLDLAGDPPASLGMIPMPQTKEQRELLRAVAAVLRSEHAEAYVDLADAVEKELALASIDLAPEKLGRIDTFRFEERALLAHAGRLTVAGEWDEAAAVVEARHRSFWADRDAGRQAQWEVCRLMAELGLQVDAVSGGLDATTDAAAWVARYTADDGWFRCDLVHRSLEAMAASSNIEPDLEAALEHVRRRHEDLLHAMASRFSRALEASGWAVPGVLHQTAVYPEVVAPVGARVAYVLVDAMRYEMGVELRRQLQDAENVVLRPAVAALPTITPVGMAALLPGASADFAVAEEKGHVAARVEGRPLRNLADRQKHLEAAVPGVVDLDIGRLLAMRTGKLRERIADAPLVVVRSQEIDALGETATALIARQLIDTAIGNVARAVHRLASVGVEYFVVAADHGHQFSLAKGEHMRTDNPKGDRVGLHRRCWIGRGGSTPPGAFRVSAPDLGYDSDVDFVFPEGAGVFRSGGGLEFHHGGVSLQELIIPVLSFRIPARSAEAAAGVKVEMSGYPDAVTNRTFGVTLRCGAGQADLFGPDEVNVRPLLLAGEEQVGEAGMAVNAEFDRAARTVQLKPGEKASVAMVLKREDCDRVRVVIQDVATSAVLASSDDLPVRLGI